MCGIFGVVRQAGAPAPAPDLWPLVRSLFRLSESRGKEASGLAVSAGGTISVLKRNMGGAALCRLPQVRSMLAEAEGGPFALIGHTRMVTNGDARNVGNNQPVVRGSLACIHNGIITNDAALWRANPALHRAHEVDTEVYLALVEHGLRDGRPLGSAARAALRQLDGANTLALLSADADGILLSTTNGSLYVATDEERGIGLFASERYFLERILVRHFGTAGRLRAGIRQVRPRCGLILAGSASLARDFELDCAGEAPALPAVRRRITDRGSASDAPAPRLAVPNRMRAADIERETRFDHSPIRSLVRCTRCVLPETFPFLRFDDRGVCSICRRRGATAYKGLEALRASLGRAGTCLAPISGGRDSCFGLHYLVRELGLRPVAYTYDWGMVTDLARRNISRMCGALGIEHVLVSADIARKREYIRQNVTAWLRRPHLGTVPLFMAGDKQFFYYAEKLRLQMRLDTILFSMNPLERTDFKVGFCGIDEGYEKARHYDPTWLNKARIAGFYGLEYLRNPAYLNASVLDTLGAYASYYLLPKRYLQLFDFLPWQEDEVERTLLDDYDWELATDTRSTWRIGDGTAAFYNYIYLRVAGFSENDTLRSNQIRDGVLSREAALARIEEENAPRIDSLAWYFDAIGVDAVAAIRRVNAMPTLYPR